MSNIMYMVTDFYEMSDVKIPWSANICVDDTDNPECQLVDSRLRIMMPYKNFSVSPIIYLNYVQTFCELTNERPNSPVARYADCGFLPIGVEPECLCNAIVRPIIIPKLVKLGIEYFMVQPLSPVWAGYKPQSDMALNKDVWVSKLEASKVVHKPVYNISTLDLLEVLFQ